ncbi:NADPH:quinone oxidoreductase family protein [Dietzia lutea]|uniref:Alcohol dehydrogenase n=1 Tax=Dietzia lutea TaxID=546160 RepID=A0A2S1RA06_9ACTN|nr:NADPH:quinone oxidoreductase family protein [Dietzia lutea]AWH93094.1 alcohol dehydrogenase [Dietzia lutea]
MKTWEVVAPGALPDSVRLVDAPEPAIGPEDVLVEVQAGALGYPDYLLAVGRYHDKPEAPFVLGGESAGVVRAIGDAVDGITVGDRVLAAPGETVFGRLAELVSIPAELALPIPDDMPMDEAAALFVAYQTAHIGLFRRANLRPGETLMVHGASGGVGSAAVELGRASGARVIAVAGGSEKAAVCRELGAHEVIDHTTENVVERVKTLTDGRGADVILDTVGGDVFTQSRKSVAVEGRILVGGFASGEIPRMPVNHALLKNYAVVGFRTRPFRDDPVYRREVHDDLVAHYIGGRIRPRVQRVGFDDVVDALEQIGNRRAVGRLVVVRD